MLFNKNVDI